MKILSIVLCLLLLTSSAIAADAGKCPDERKGHGSGGRSVTELMNESTKARQKAMNDINQNALKEKEKSNNESSEFFDKCVSKINGSLTLPILSGLWDSVKDALMYGVCNASKQLSNQLIGEALNKLQMDLPYGLGTIGANSDIGGYQLSNVNQGSGGWKINPDKGAGADVARRGGSVLRHHTQR